jgi:ABC-type polysaccharide/polyol phosphate transport system ATPase subunit
MFDTTKTPMTERLADAADLVIDFATLGEYGLEPVDRPSSPCEARRRLANRRSTGAWARAIDRFATQA